jgi:hypothetical protein
MGRHLPSLMTRAVAAVPAVVALVTTAVLLLAPPAGAERLTVRDAPGDMWKIEEGGIEPWRVPGATQGDVLRTTFRHRTDRVVVRARFADLRRAGKRFTFWVLLREGNGHLTYLGVEATRRNRAGRTILMTTQGDDIRCAMRHRIDYADDTVRVGLPRRCLGNPRVLQFRAMSEQVRRTWRYAYLDNALGDTIDSHRWTRRIRRG